MVEIHCHLLPGIDDGPRDLDESMELARWLASDGIRTVVATPHLRDDHPRVVPGELAARSEDARARLSREGIPLDVLPGGEVDVTWALEASDDALRLASYAQRGTDLLVEAPYGPLPTTFEDLIFRIQVRGYRVLLAHPERNHTFQADPDRLGELMRKGVLVQVTADALARRPRRSRSARLAHSLVREGVAHVLSTDAHGQKSITRSPLSAGVEIARKLAGARADWMATEAPLAILEGRPLPPAPDSGRRRLGLVRRRAR